MEGMDAQRGSREERAAAAGIEEVAAVGPGAGAPGRGPEPGGGGTGGGGTGRTGTGRPGIGRWLPVLAVAGLAVVIVGAGLLGPKVPSREEPVPADPPASPAASPGPAGSPSATPPAVAGTPVPRLRLAGTLPDDRYLLLGGRWIDLGTGTVDVATGCELERPLVLAGGRIVCVARQKARPPGSTWATYDLSIVTLGRSRPAPAEPWASTPPSVGEGVEPAVPLTKLVGRRDLAFGDPVAVAPAPGAEPDSLLLAWAVLGDGGYRVGLDRYVVEDGAAVATGSREVLALPLEDELGPTSLADLAVSVSPDGGTALVGVTVTRTSPAPSVRRLAVLRIDAGAAAGGAVGEARALPPEVTSNATGPADVARDDGTACGGALGEGWATDETLYLVCAGRPSVFRRVTLPAAAAAPGSGGASVRAAVVDETLFSAASGVADALLLAGDGEAIDRLRGRYYRWEPATRLLWAIDLLAPPRARAVADSVALGWDRPTGTGDPGVADPGPASRPVVGIDVAADRLYLLAPDADGRGAWIEVVSGVDLVSRGSLPTSPEPYAAMALSPDGRLLYLATPPRETGGAPRPLVAVEVLDTEPLAARLFAGRLPPGPWDSAQPIVVR